MKPRLFIQAALICSTVVLTACDSREAVVFHEVVAPKAHDFRVEPKPQAPIPTLPTASPIAYKAVPTITSADQFISANGELCTRTAGNGVACNVNGQNVTVSGIISGSI